MVNVQCWRRVAKKTSTYKCCKNIYKYKLLAERGRGQQWRYQKRSSQNRQNSSQEINILWKLYRLILDKYSYTSLELAVPPDALRAYLIANRALPSPKGWQ